MPEATFKKSVETQGHAIKTFKANKGQCCEFHGQKDGQNVGHGFNLEAGARVTR